MFLKILTILDLGVLALLLLMHFSGYNSWRLMITASLYLIAKGILFFGDLFSIMDIGAAIYIVLVFFGLNVFLTYVFLAYFGYKIVLGFAG